MVDRIADDPWTGVDIFNKRRERKPGPHQCQHERQTIEALGETTMVRLLAIGDEIGANRSVSFMLS